MRKTWKMIGLLLIPAYLSAAPEVVIVADTRHLTGVRAWWGNLYNESHLQFALMTVVLVPLAGIILGSLADLAMQCTGIDLKSRVLREG
ncbi:MAG TPA: DVU0150 family protein [Bryobacteraceae bacterium]|nr:DVU0150 family protein [Bryobacteraceae bacterium]